MSEVTSKQVGILGTSWSLDTVVVGKPLYEPFEPMPEGAFVEITPLGVQLTMFVHGPADVEIQAVSTGRAAMRLLAESHTMLFLAKFGSTSWVEAPFNVHRLPPENRECLPDPGEGYGWPLTAVLADAQTGTVAALRKLALSRRFSVAILREYEKQAGRAPDDVLHQKQVLRLRRKSTATLAAEAIDRFEQGDTAS